MIESVPGRDFASRDGRGCLFAQVALNRRVARTGGRALPGGQEPPCHEKRLPVEGINAASGLVSTVRDLAQVRRGARLGRPRRQDTLAASWSPRSRRIARRFPPVWAGSSRTIRHTGRLALRRRPQRLLGADGQGALTSGHDDPAREQRQAGCTPISSRRGMSRGRSSRRCSSACCFEIPVRRARWVLAVAALLILAPPVPGCRRMAVHAVPRLYVQRLDNGRGPRAGQRGDALELRRLHHADRRQPVRRRSLLRPHTRLLRERENRVQRGRDLHRRQPHLRVHGERGMATPRGWNRYGLRPFISGGLGLLHASRSDTQDIIPINDLDMLGMNIGGGAVGLLTERAACGTICATSGPSTHRMDDSIPRCRSAPSSCATGPRASASSSSDSSSLHPGPDPHHAEHAVGVFVVSAPRGGRGTRLRAELARATSKLLVMPASA